MAAHEKTNKTTPVLIEEDHQPSSRHSTSFVPRRFFPNFLSITFPKKGNIVIKIVRHNAAGEVILHWQVSPNRDYGDPRALAYKIDTLIINRRLDELGRPLPKLVPLGSLRQIGVELGIPSNTGHIKNALHQNASAYITAKLSYIANDHTPQRLEAGLIVIALS